ncbi:hypothetical protein JCM17823_29170 [Halorubrum gandharaense]
MLFVTSDEFVKENARNAINWQIMVTVYTIISVILLVVGIGALMLAALGIVNLVFIVVAAVKASDGKAWSYPLTPDLL